MDLSNLYEVVGSKREAIGLIRSQMRLKANWFLMKTQLLRYIMPSNLQSLEYRDEEIYKDLKPAKKVRKRLTYKDAISRH